MKIAAKAPKLLNGIFYVTAEPTDLRVFVQKAVLLTRMNYQLIVTEPMSEAKFKRAIKTFIKTECCDKAAQKFKVNVKRGNRTVLDFAVKPSL